MTRSGKNRAFLEAEILKLRNVTIPAKDWEAFERWMKSPPREIAGLKALARIPLPWDESSSRQSLTRHCM
jgi:hypothetical protein